MNKILQVLKEHLPYTFLGVVLATIFIFPLSKIENLNTYGFFYTLHPLHIFLSAFATTSFYTRYNPKKVNWIKVFFISYLGSIIISSVSDSFIPYLSESILKMPLKEIHFGFLEETILVNLAAVLGILLGFFKPKTKISHLFHIFVSSFASLFHMLMANKILNFGIVFYISIFLFLFLGVMIPCSFSDMIFPLLFIKKTQQHLCDTCKKESGV